MPPVFHLFVYGSLRSGFRNPAYEYISRYFKLLGPGKVKGVLYDMGEYPAALPSSEDHYLVGELYYVKDEHEFNWAIAQLDDYEGIKVEAGEHPEYRRDLVEVECIGSSTMAWIYWYNSPIMGRPVIESGDVLKYMQEKKQF